MFINIFFCCLHNVLYYTNIYKLKYKIILKVVQKIANTVHVLDISTHHVMVTNIIIIS